MGKDTAISSASTTSAPRGTSNRKLKRREQQRAIETRTLILDASLTEFAQRGFEAASIRRIAERTRLQHPLITYHFRTKLILWRAVAEYAFAEIRAAWDRQAPPDSDQAPVDRVRAEAMTFQSSLSRSGRTGWILSTFWGSWSGPTPNVRLF